MVFVANPFTARTYAGFLCGSLLVAGTLTACNSPSPPPSPQARQQEAAEAQRKAASVEAAMNENAHSEDIAKKPGEPPVQ